MQLTQKELDRASEDGYVIVSRPDKVNGGYIVQAVCINGSEPVGWRRHVKYNETIAEAATSIQRDLNKFLGIGGKMSCSGRLRVSRKAANRKIGHNKIVL